MTRKILWFVMALATASPAIADGPTPDDPAADDAAAAVETSVTILSGQRATRLDALVLGERLWVPVDRLEEVSGFTLKPEGICDPISCYPVPEGKGWIKERGGERFVDLTSFAAHIAQPVAYEAEGPIFSFAAAEGIPGAPLAGGMAPDFTLPNRTGEQVSLSDFRGKKVLIVTWASW